ncbi:hypothetical protein AB06_2205 [Escherichia coli 2-474-04_S1_C1]|nr:hypothetical protein AB06_2205 [Escherichia coli 2-474-04_S1_C1]
MAQACSIYAGVGMGVNGRGLPRSGGAGVDVSLGLKDG